MYTLVLDILVLDSIRSIANIIWDDVGWYDGWMLTINIFNIICLSWFGGYKHDAISYPLYTVHLSPDLDSNVNPPISLKEKK